MITIQTPAIVTRGHRVASGSGDDLRFPRGTIRPQLPAFRRAIPEFEAWLGAPAWPGTINLALPGEARSLTPDHVVPAVAWTDLFPPENFFLSRCLIELDGARHPAWLYIPDPATKPDHAQPSNIVELLAARVPGLDYGRAVTLHYAPATLAVTAG